MVSAVQVQAAQPKSSSSAMAHRLRAVVHLFAVIATTPLLLFYVLRQYLRRLRLPWKAAPCGTPTLAHATSPRTVLVTGGKMAKSLNITRALWRAGHRVVLVETDKYWCSGSRLSKSVWAFATVADPRFDGDAYLADLQRVFEEYGCDTFLPVSSPFAAHFDAMFLRSKEEPTKLLSKASTSTLSTQASTIKDEDDMTVASTSSSDEDNRSLPSTNLSTVELISQSSKNSKRSNFNTSSDLRLPRNMHFKPSICDMMDDKHSFWAYCNEVLGLPSSDSNDCGGAMLPSHHLSSDSQVLALNKQLQKDGRPDKYVLKNLGYDPLHRLDLFCLPASENTVKKYLDKIRADGNAITAQEPWQAQLFIEKGTEMSCFAVLRDSSLELYTCSLSSASQLRYVHAGTTSGAALTSARNAGHTKLVDAQAAACRRWVDAFCAALRERGERLDGQLCWDFMCTHEENTRAFPLECNPRVHSQTAVFGAANGDQKKFGEVLMGSAQGKTLVPSMDTDPQAETHFWGWWANEFYSLQDTSYLLRMLEMLHLFLSSLCVMLGLLSEHSSPVFQYAKASDENATWYTSHFSFRDSDFDHEDPLPFFGRNLLQPLVLFWGVFLSGNEWTKYDFCIGKVVEKNGD